MNHNVMIDAISAIDPKYIIEYVQYETKLGIIKSRRKRRTRILLVSAACLALVFSLLLVTLPLSFVVLGSEPVQKWSSQVIESVIFPLDQQPENPEDPDHPEEPAQSPLQLNWIEWEITEKLFSALGAGTDNSAINKLQSMQGGFVGESMQDLGDFLERLYEYYMKHKDEIDAIIGETDTESEQEGEFEMSTEKETETQLETETAPIFDTAIDTDVVIEHNLEYTLSESGDYYIVTRYIDKGESLVVIPDLIYGIPIKEIGSGVFQYAVGIEEVYIPQGVEKIGEDAFDGCYNLRSVQMPDNLKELGISAFYNCYSLSEIVIPDGVEVLPWRAFEGCSSLQSIELPDSIRAIDSRTFYGCVSLKDFTLPETLTFIGGEAFRQALKDVDLILPNGIQTIEGSAFYCSYVNSVYVPDGVTEIGAYAFADCIYLTEMSLPASLQRIDLAGICNAKTSQVIEFRGTKSEWNQIRFDSQALWGEKTIKCTDGEIVIE